MVQNDQNRYWLDSSEIFVSSVPARKRNIKVSAEARNESTVSLKYIHANKKNIQQESVIASVLKTKSKQLKGSKEPYLLVYMFQTHSVMAEQPKRASIVAGYILALHCKLGT